MASTQTWSCWWWLWYWFSWSICAQYYDDVDVDHNDDVDAPGQLVLTIMMMLVLTIMMMLMLLVNLCSPLWWCCWWRWGSTAEYQLRGQWWKWGLNFTAAVFTSSTPFPSYWSVMELMEFILTWWRVYIRIVICCLTTISYQLIHSATLINCWFG